MASKERPRAVPQRARGRHTDLQPLTTTQIHAARQRDMMTSYRNPIPSPISALSLGSPTHSVARQYYQETRLPLTPVNEPPIIQHVGTSEVQHFPRRHSDQVSQQLSNRLNRFTVSSPVPRQDSPLSTSSSRTIAEESRLQLLDGVERSELGRLGTMVTKLRPVESGKLISEPNGKIPFNYTHDKLRSWGRVYLGNWQTADALVKAVHLKRPVKSKAETKSQSIESSAINEASQEDNAMTVLSEQASKLPDMETTGPQKPLPPLPIPCKQKADPDLVTIRARVVPKSKERRPFLLQRQFNLKELRDSVPAPSKSKEETGRAGMISRSQSLSARVRAVANARARNGEVSNGVVASGSKSVGVMPIHIEYALHFLPILAALMLSGHIRKGDGVDLPLPHPKVWDQVVSYVYTGEGEVSDAMKENILYLGGRID